MSTKTSQRKPKSAASASEIATAAAPATAAVAAPTSPPAAPVAPAPVVAPALASAAPEQVSKAPRGSKRKAPSSVEEDVKAEKKQKGSKKASSETSLAVEEKKPSGKKSKAEGKLDDSKPAFKPRKPKAKPEASPESLSGGGDAAAAAVAAVAAVAAASPSAAAASTAEEVNTNPNLLRYLRTLLKAHYPEYTISKEAIQEVQRLVYQFGLHFFVTVKRHLESAKKNTLMPPDVPICLQRVLSGSTLYADFSEAVCTAVNRYESSYPKVSGEAKDVESVAAAVDEKRKQMWAARAGLSIPPTRIKEFAKQYLSAFRFSQLSITALTALLERLAILVFRLSYEKAQELNRKRISQADVQSAIKNYTDLQWLAIVPQLPLV